MGEPSQSWCSHPEARHSANGGDPLRPDQFGRCSVQMCRPRLLPPRWLGGAM